MRKIKSISKFITTYNLTTTYDDTVEETKRFLSYIEYDMNGNTCCDKTYNEEGICENYCKRVYNENHQMAEEYLFEMEEDIPYESRKNKFDENGFLIESEVNYLEEKVLEKFSYNKNGNLIEKTIVYPDGYSYIENKYSWKNDLLVEECDFQDEDSMSIRKIYMYDEKNRLVALEEHDFNQDNKITENYEYNDFGMTQQTVLNFKGEIMIKRNFTYDENGLMLERIVETPSQFIRYIFEYDENNLLVKESRLNKDELILTLKEISYNEDKEEIEANVYSRNIVENNDELMLIETYTTEFDYF